jgi:hypothetical protein
MLNGAQDATSRGNEKKTKSKDEMQYPQSIVHTVLVSLGGPLCPLAGEN